MPAHTSVKPVRSCKAAARVDASAAGSGGSSVRATVLCSRCSAGGLRSGIPVRHQGERGLGQALLMGDFVEVHGPAGALDDAGKLLPVACRRHLRKGKAQPHLAHADVKAHVVEIGVGAKGLGHPRADLLGDPARRGGRGGRRWRGGGGIDHLVELRPFRMPAQARRLPLQQGNEGGKMGVVPAAGAVPQIEERRRAPRWRGRAGQQVRRPGVAGWWHPGRRPGRSRPAPGDSPGCAPAGGGQTATCRRCAADGLCGAGWYCGRAGRPAPSGRHRRRAPAPLPAG